MATLEGGEYSFGMATLEGGEYSSRMATLEGGEYSYRMATLEGGEYSYRMATLEGGEYSPRMATLKSTIPCCPLAIEIVSSRNIHRYNPVPIYTCLQKYYTKHLSSHKFLAVSKTRTEMKPANGKGSSHIAPAPSSFGLSASWLPIIVVVKDLELPPLWWVLLGSCKARNETKQNKTKR